MLTGIHMPVIDEIRKHLIRQAYSLIKLPGLAALLHSQVPPIQRVGVDRAKQLGALLHDARKLGSHFRGRGKARAEQAQILRGAVGREGGPGATPTQLLVSLEDRARFEEVAVSEGAEQHEHYDWFGGLGGEGEDGGLELGVD